MDGLDEETTFYFERNHYGTCADRSFLYRKMGIFNIFHRQDVVDGLVALRTNVMHSMEDGNDSDIFYVKNVKIKDISDINKYVDSAFGSVDTYQYWCPPAIILQFNFLLIGVRIIM